MAEEPTITEPKADEPKPAGEIDSDALLAKLQEFEKTTVEDIEGMHRASREAGNTARLLGDERKRVQFLEAEIEKLKVDNQNQRQDYFNPDYHENSVDIEKMIEQSVNKSVGNALTAYQKSVAEAQEMAYADHEAVVNNRHYKDKNIRELFDNKMADPTVQMQMRRGKLTGKQILDMVAHEYKDTLLKELTTKFESLSKPLAPHVEQGGQGSQNIVSGKEEEDPNKKRLSELREKANKGGLLSEEEELELIQLI